MGQLGHVLVLTNDHGVVQKGKVNGVPVALFQSFDTCLGYLPPKQPWNGSALLSCLPPSVFLAADGCSQLLPTLGVAPRTGQHGLERLWLTSAPAVDEDRLEEQGQAQGATDEQEIWESTAAAAVVATVPVAASHAELLQGKSENEQWARILLSELTSARQLVSALLPLNTDGQVVNTAHAFLDRWESLCSSLQANLP
jgi:hypothetical protein